jgi:hypothetical protein
MTRSLKVFVSCALDELGDERLALKQALQSLPLSVEWDFDFTSMASGKVSNEYLERLWDCDFYALLIGQRVPEPVAREYEVAVEAEKPIVTLVHDVPRGKETVDFIKKLKVKPRPRYFITLEGLIAQVQAGFSDELIKNYKRLRLDPAEMKEVATQRVESIAKERQQARDWKGSTFLMVMLLIIVGVAVLVGRGKNTAPVIDQMFSEPAQVTVGEKSLVHVRAKDPENGSLTYQWMVTTGSIDPKEAMDSPYATFSAPDRPMTVTVQVVVGDPLGLEARQTIDIAVVGK